MADKAKTTAEDLLPRGAPAAPMATIAAAVPSVADLGRALTAMSTGELSSPIDYDEGDFLDLEVIENVPPGMPAHDRAGHALRYFRIGRDNVLSHRLLQPRNGKPAVAQPLTRGTYEMLTGTKADPRMFNAQGYHAFGDCVICVAREDVAAKRDLARAAARDDRYRSLFAPRDRPNVSVVSGGEDPQYGYSYAERGNLPLPTKG